MLAYPKPTDSALHFAAIVSGVRCLRRPFASSPDLCTLVVAPLTQCRNVYDVFRWANSWVSTKSNGDRCSAGGENIDSKMKKLDAENEKLISRLDEILPWVVELRWYKLISFTLIHPSRETGPPLGCGMSRQSTGVPRIFNNKIGYIWEYGTHLACRRASLYMGPKDWMV